MVDVEKLSKKRNAMMAGVEKLVSDCENWLQLDVVNNKNALETNCVILQKKVAKIVEITDKIVDELDDEAVMGKEMHKCTQIEQRVESLILVIKSELLKFEKPNAVVVGTVPDVQPATRRKADIRLPKLNLKPYDGDPLKWKTFFDTFDCAVHKRDDMTNVEKMTYLISLLEGEAESCIGGITLSNENYEVALKMLKQRFGDEQILISAHMNKLLNLETTSNFIDIRELRSLYNNIEIQVRNLRGIGLEEKRYGPMLAPVIMSKLPQEIKLLLTRKFGKDVWAIDKLLETLQQEVEAREKVLLTENEGVENYENLLSSSRSTSDSSKRRSQPFKSFPCVYCGNKKHKSFQCSKVTKPESRLEFLSKEKRCFKCLKQGHQAKDCSSRRTCYHCERNHHSSVCKAFKKNSQKDNSAEDTQSNLAGSSNTVLLQTAKAKIENTEKSKLREGRILFDSGSQLSYVTPKLSEKLKLKTIGKKELCIQTFGNKKSVKTLPLVEFYVKTSKGRVPVQAYVSDISQPISKQKTVECSKMYKHLRGLKLADPNYDSSIEIDILLGSNFYWDFIHTEGAVTGKTGQPIALSSDLGYILSGPADLKEKNSSGTFFSHVLKADVSEEDRLSETVEKFWKLESLGIKVENRNENREFVKEFENSLLFDENENMYEATYPLKNCFDLGDNYEISRKRLQSLTKTFENNRELLNEYQKIFEDQITKGVIERAPVDNEVGKVHYIPHHAVIRPEKSTTKTRIVYDASAKANDEELFSLNECLEAGPSLNTDLYEILLRFRANKVAIVGDIEKAFLHIKLNNEQRDLTRFLWFKNPDKINYKNFDENELIEYRMCRVLFGINASPFVLNATLQHHIRTANDPEFENELIKSLHVDDLTTSTETVADAELFVDKTKDHLSKASFNLRKFQSNSKELESKLQAKYGETDNPTVTGKTKVLGVIWDKENDELCFELKTLMNLKPTKRNVLKALASIYDPLGLINPIVLTLKLFFQKLCLNKLDWDTPLDGDLLAEWQSIVNDFEYAKEIRVERAYQGVEKVKEVQLHGFSDASDDAHGCCIYTRIVTNDGEIKTSLVTAKSHVNPIKSKTKAKADDENLTTPRMELVAILILSRLMKVVQEHFETNFEFEKLTVWTDNSIAYCWVKNIKTTRKQDKFVQNIVKEIRENHEALSIDLKLVASKKNPSDIESRGSKPACLAGNKLWFYGPDFLSLPESQWPRLKVGDKFSEGSDPLTKPEEKGEPTLKTLSDGAKKKGPDPLIIPEVKGTTLSINFSDGTERITIPEAQSKPCNLGKIIDVRRFRSFEQLLRVTGYVLKFVENIRYWRNKKKEINKKEIDKKQRSNILNADDLVSAKKKWLVDAQRGIPDEMMENLFLGGEVYRWKGRLNNAPIPFDAKHPIWLPSNCPLIDLLIKDAHEKVMHNGQRETLNELRSQFHIPKLRQRVRHFIFKCTICKRHGGKPYRYPESYDLPKSRLEAGTAFKNIGIDYCGPYLVYNVFDKTKEKFKVWIALITCQASRAVYLDIATDYSGESCIEVLRRFMNRRGIPVEIFSDKGTSFTSENVQSFATNCHVRWKFSLEKAPWFNGFTERLVKSVKSCLCKALNNRTLKYDEFISLLSEIERTINNRPLTYIYDELTEEPLTPNHLLYGRRLGHNDTEIELSTSTKHAIEHFWRRWKTEYLLELRETHKKGHRTTGEIIRENDIVLISEENVKRNEWRRGRVSKLLRGRDGRVRGAELVVVNKTGNGLLRRPINKLFPFEHCSRPTKDDEVKIKFVDERSLPLGVGV